MRLANLEGYLKFPGPFPVASIRLKYVSRPKAAERFVPRSEDAAGPAGGRDDVGIEASAPVAEPGGDDEIAIPALPEPARRARSRLRTRAGRADGPDPCRCRARRRMPRRAPERPRTADRKTGTARRRKAWLPGAGPGIAI